MKNENKGSIINGIAILIGVSSMAVEDKKIVAIMLCGAIILCCVGYNFMAAESMKEENNYRFSPGRFCLGKTCIRCEHHVLGNNHCFHPKGNLRIVSPLNTCNNWSGQTGFCR